MIVQGIEVAEWVYGVTGGCVSKNTLGIGYVIDGVIVAGFALENYNGGHVIVHQRHEKTAPRSFWYECANHIFNVLKVKRITGMCNASNEKAKRLNKHIGFEYETTLKQAGDDGEDMEIWVCWKDKCKPLGWSRHNG